MVVHPVTLELNSVMQEDEKSEVSLGYIKSSRLAWAPWDHVREWDEKKV